MIPDKYFTSTRLILLVTFFVFSFSKTNAQDGKAVFLAKCASCHSMGNDGATGPNLQGVVERWGGDVNLVNKMGW
ncbi:MAG: c-type cytochrome [Bacteroidetes bacterium]|nr:MAG: c-type cytochrome [Bacteroidota bacterium]